MRCALCLYVTLVTLLTGQAVPGEEMVAQLHFIDVGEGQCTLIDLGEKEIIVDGGQHGDVLREYLDFTNVIDPPIELVVITHADSNAWGGLSAVFLDKATQSSYERTDSTSGPWAPISVSEVWEPGEDFRTEKEKTQPRFNTTFNGFLAKIESKKETAIKRPLARFHPPALDTGNLAWFQLDSIPQAQFAVLSSGTVVDPKAPKASRQNDASIVFMMKVGNRTVYFGGGVHGVDRHGKITGVEAKLVQLAQETPGVLKSDILIGPRNGSNTASSLEYIAAISPELVLFGTSKVHRHPRPDVLARYQKLGVPALVTDLHPQGGRDHIIVEWADKSELRKSFAVGYGLGEEKRQSEWAGRDQEGKIITKSDIKDWLRRLERYARQGGRTDPRILYRKADFCRVDLKGKDLSDCDFTETKFREAHLEGAILTRAKLSKADLRAAYLSGSVLNEADLFQAKLGGSDLRKADFRGTILTEANLNEANLGGARLVDCFLKDALFANTDLSNLIFEPQDLSIKNPRELRRSPYLSTFTYENSPHALIELRKDVWDAGFEEAGRELTYVIEKGRSDRARAGEKWFRRVFFEWPVGYGRNPVRPLLIVLGLAVVLAIPYWVAIHCRQSGIFRVPAGSPVGMPGELREATRIRARGLRAWLFALYFSFVSAFHIGWRELNVGNWLLSFQPRDELLRANGWTRTLAGVQSLISVYLFALTILSYFGRLFA